MENLILYTSTYEKIRLGKPHDGGYVITKLPENYDLFISGGIANDVSFEKNLLSLYPNLKAYAFDGSINYLPENVDNLFFVKKFLGNHNDEYTTNLIEYIENYNDMFFKIDIEGHEFRLMPEIINKGYITKIKQLVIEIHSPADINMFPDYFKGLQDINNDSMFNLLNEFNKTHTLIHFHANNGCKMQKINDIDLPHVFELTYIRNDFVTERIKNKEPLPTSIDMKNICDKPDYSFNCYPYCN
jgi:hypothetical protein